jgi:hypothetical protein
LRGKSALYREIHKNGYLLPNFHFMAKEKTVQKAAKKEPAKSLKEKQAQKKAKKESNKNRS